MIDGSTEFYCDGCLQDAYANTPHKKQQLARCYGCDEIILCSGLDPKTLKPKPQEGMPWDVMFGD